MDTGVTKMFAKSRVKEDSTNCVPMTDKEQSRYADFSRSLSPSAFYDDDDDDEYDDEETMTPEESLFRKEEL